MKTKIAIMALVAATLTACNESDVKVTSEYITVDASVGALTRATSTSFESGDAISIYAWTGSNSTVSTPLVVNNSINTYNGTSWTAAPQMLWKDLSSSHYFIGVHPSKEITDFTNDTYATAADILVATVLESGRKAADGIVPMTFDHVMSKLVVNLTFRNQWAETPIVSSVNVLAKSSSTVNYIAKTANASGEASDISMTATTQNTAYSTIIAPQDITKVTITIDGKAYTYTHETSISMAGGKVQTLNLVVGRDGITLGSITINDWKTGVTIDGGEALN